MTDETTRCCLARDIGLLILRVGFGGFMAGHGFGKVKMVFAGEFPETFDPIGLGPTLSVISAAGAEFVCALLVIVGLAARLASAPIVFTMLVAAFVVHASDPLMMSGGGAKEPALLFALAFLAIALAGPGRLSVDQKLEGKLPIFRP